jgi:hypothetical protein
MPGLVTTIGDDGDAGGAAGVFVPGSLILSLVLNIPNFP